MHRSHSSFALLAFLAVGGCSLFSPPIMEIKTEGSGTFNKVTLRGDKLAPDGNYKVALPTTVKRGDELTLLYQRNGSNESTPFVVVSISKDEKTCTLSMTSSDKVLNIGTVEVAPCTTK